jgi:carbamoyltransferase
MSNKKTVMAINPGHNGSTAVVCDGELVYYAEEERYSRFKYDANPFRGMIHALTNYKIDNVVIGGTLIEFSKVQWTYTDYYDALIRKYQPKVEIEYAGMRHHDGHAWTTFYNSGFDDALVIIIDGCGTHHYYHILDSNGKVEREMHGFETESIYTMSYDKETTLLMKNCGNNSTWPLDDGVVRINEFLGIVKVYEAVTIHLGWGAIEAGKTMGLAPYGKDNPNIPDLYVNGFGNKQLFKFDYPSGAYINPTSFGCKELEFKYLNDEERRRWHKDENLVTQLHKDLAYKVQKESQELALDMIKSWVEKTGVKRVCIAGGFGLNCVANYYYRKNLPKDVEIYCEPVAHDGGTSIGLAKQKWYSLTGSTKKFPLKTSYLGEQYDPKTYLNNVDVDAFDIKDITAPEVAKLIADRNIVALYQGRAEAGPRALGNRSILYDPTDPNGKAYVNTVKGREWFRPFAGSVLKEHANDWFDMAGMDESPHMMYAVDVQADKVDKIPCITHVDDTCRIQTVTPEQNKHYYELISEFNKITGVPILFNTSLNLGGDALVETIDDAIDTLVRSNMKYLYLPEIGKLITKK